MEGSADRALGRWYFKVPRLFGGSNKEAEAHLRASLRYNPDSTISHFFLAELFLDDDRKSEARAEFQAVIDAPSQRRVGAGRPGLQSPREGTTGETQVGGYRSKSEV